MTRSDLRHAVLTVAVLLFVSPVMAGYSVDVYIDNVPAYTVNDNGVGDDNPAVGDIAHHFLLNDVANRWRAEGDIFADGGYDGALPVSTVVTDTLIEKIANVPIFFGEVDFYHHYAASGLQTHDADIDGVFDNTFNHLVGGASLFYSADGTGFDLGTYATGLYVGPGPAPFMGSLGPVQTPTTILHHMTLGFYLDTLGDSIEMFNSAMIRTTPEPASAVLLLAAGALLKSRRAVTKGRAA